MTAVVSAYRCGAVPDFHRVPSFREHNMLRSTNDREHYIVRQPVVKERQSKNWSRYLDDRFIDWAAATTTPCVP
jgi:hypothetical protein